jgi:hypothetical protein
MERLNGKAPAPEYSSGREDTGAELQAPAYLTPGHWI